MTLKLLGFNKFKGQDPFQKAYIETQLFMKKIVQFRNHLLNEMWTFKTYLKFKVSL